MCVCVCAVCVCVRACCVCVCVKAIRASEQKIGCHRAPPDQPTCHLAQEAVDMKREVGGHAWQLRHSDRMS